MAAEGRVTVSLRRSIMLLGLVTIFLDSFEYDLARLCQNSLWFNVNCQRGTGAIINCAKETEFGYSALPDMDLDQVMRNLKNYCLLIVTWQTLESDTGL